MITQNSDIENLIASNAPVAIGVSGGKDSQAAALASFHYLDQKGHVGPRILIHADLGSVEWKDSHRICKKLAEHLNCELVVVSRKAGGMMQRWQRRWELSKERYINLETVMLVPAWSTPSMRFCTSELKTNVIVAELKRRFKGQKIINITGVRRDESANRAKMPVLSIDPKNIIYNWRSIIDLSEEQVFSIIDQSGLEPHPAYRKFGMTRVSCRFCIMSNANDLVAAARQAESHEIYKEMVELEADSAFAFQGSRWLGNVYPELLNLDLREKFTWAKAVSNRRKQIFSKIPKRLHHSKIWPVTVPDREDAEFLSRARKEICEIYGFKSEFLEPKEIQEKYRKLIEEREKA